MALPDGSAKEECRSAPGLGETSWDCVVFGRVADTYSVVCCGSSEAQQEATVPKQMIHVVILKMELGRFL